MQDTSSNNLCVNEDKILDYAVERLSHGHTEFQDKIISHLWQRGFVVMQTGYHDLFPRTVCDDIRANTNSMTDLRVRALPDLVVMDTKDHDVKFFIDIKASNNPNIIYIEIFPWACNIQRSILGGLKTLYALRKNTTGQEVGFWADDYHAKHLIKNILYRRVYKPLPQEAIKFIHDWFGTTHFVITDEVPKQVSVSGDCCAIIEGPLRGLRPIEDILNL